jgi:hypothetical protein
MLDIIDKNRETSILAERDINLYSHKEQWSVDSGFDHPTTDLLF